MSGGAGVIQGEYERLQGHGMLRGTSRAWAKGLKKRGFGCKGMRGHDFLWHRGHGGAKIGPGAHTPIPARACLGSEGVVCERGQRATSLLLYPQTPPDTRMPLHVDASAHTHPHGRASPPARSFSGHWDAGTSGSGREKLKQEELGSNWKTELSKFQFPFLQK